MGKGTWPRPYSKGRADYEDKWEATFGDKSKEKCDKCVETEERINADEETGGEEDSTE